MWMLLIKQVPSLGCRRQRRKAAKVAPCARRVARRAPASGKHRETLLSSGLICILSLQLFFPLVPNYYFQQTQEMDLEQPARPVAETIASFRAINPDGKSPEEYQSALPVPQIISLLVCFIILIL
jgi:hypothetical protein